MLDFIFIAATAIFVIAGILYVHGCEKLRGTKSWALQMPPSWLFAACCWRTCFMRFSKPRTS